MAKKANLRNATVACPYIIVMKGNGVIYPAEYASNRRGGAIEVSDGEPRLRQKYVKKGYKLLDEIADNDEQRAFWPHYIEEGRRLKGRLKVDKALIEKMTPKAAKEALKAFASKDHLKMAPLAYNDDLEARPRAEPKGKKAAEKPSDKTEEPKG